MLRGVLGMFDILYDVFASASGDTLLSRCCRIKGGEYPLVTYHGKSISQEASDVLRTDGQTVETFDSFGYTEQDVEKLKRRAREFEELKRAKSPSQVLAELQQQ